MQRASFAIAAVTLLGSTFHSSGLAAQQPVQDWSRFVPRVSAAGAFDARNNGRSDPEMYLGLMSLEWGTGVPRLSVRLDGVYAKRDWATRFEPLCPMSGSVQVECVYPDDATHSVLSSKVAAAGAMVGVTYELRDRGTIRPYLLSAAGMLRSHDRYVTSKWAPLPPCAIEGCAINPIGPPSTERNERPLSAAAEFGGGLALSFRRVSAFAEARYYAVGYSNTRVLRGAVPVSLGLRF